VNRGEDGSVREEGEALEEDIFSAIGGLASRAGVFGKEDKKAEWWRRKGAAAAEDAIDSAMRRAKDVHPTAKKKILRQVRKDFIEGGYRAEVGIIRKKAEFAVKQANWAAREKQQGREEAEWNREREREASAKASRSAAASRAEEERLADIENKKQREREWRTADIRGSYAPSAGSSTDRTRRRNRGELEEAGTYPSREETRTRKDAQVAAWQKKRAGNERVAAGGEPKPPSKFTQRARANYQAKLKAKAEKEKQKGAAQPAGTAAPDEFQQKFAAVGARKAQKQADQAEKKAEFQRRMAAGGASRNPESMFEEGREKWSSYKDAQVLTENWRKFLKEHQTDRGWAEE
tara:strand:+ start:4027 stop:5070 length:1044 start_codon:yes stop_codon:yes gene_type:complete